MPHTKEKKNIKKKPKTTSVKSKKNNERKYNHQKQNQKQQQQQQQQNQQQQKHQQQQKVTQGKKRKNPPTSTTSLQEETIVKKQKTISKDKNSITNDEIAPAVLSKKVIGGNWQVLSKVVTNKKKHESKWKIKMESENLRQVDGTELLKDNLFTPIYEGDKSVTKIVALDCEMVGVGIDGNESMLARVAIINSHGNLVYDKHVKPMEDVVDYRTKYSGIRKVDLSSDEAIDFKVVQQEVANIIDGRIVVGHSLENDFKALMLRHPYNLTRDTAAYPPLMKGKHRPRALRELTKKILKVEIQTGEHDPAEDARAALLLYKYLREDWEAWMRKKLKKRFRGTKKIKHKPSALLIAATKK